MTHNCPFVSVILPVYNVDRYLRETLDSLVSQSLEDIEIICIDDGSTDGSGAILSAYKDLDDRIRVISQENKGAAAARNCGIECARGEYLAILDSDDVYEQDMLEAAYKKAKEDDADIVVFRCDELYTQTGQVKPYPNSIQVSLLPSHQPFSALDIDQDAFKLFIGWSWDKLIRRSFVEAWNLRFQELRTSNDMYFVFCSVLRAERISTIDDVFVHHRKGVGGLAETREKSWGCFHEALNAIRAKLVEWGLYERFERDYINYCLHASFWNHDTLAEPAKSKLRQALVEEWFEEFGIAGKPESYFYNKNEYRKYERLVGSFTPHISIIIPSLNSEEYYEECIASALKQTMDRIEVICVDAGSVDATTEIIANHARKDPRVRLIESDMKSYGHQMNLGFAAAHGEYCMILESDDYISDDACEYYYGIATEYDLDFVKSDHAVFVGDGKKREFTVRPLTALRAYYGRVLDPSADTGSFELQNLCQPGIYKSSFLRANEIALNESPGASFQDNGFWFQVFTQAKRVYFTDKVCYYLRRDNPGSSVSSKGKVFAICDEYDFIRRKAKERGLDEYLGVCAYRRFSNYLWTATRIGDYHRPAFFERFASDFKELEEAGELDRSYFSPRQWSTLQEIMLHGSNYYYLEWSYKRQIRSLQNDKAKLKAQLKRARRSYAKLKESLPTADIEIEKAEKKPHDFKARHVITLPARVLKHATGALKNNRTKDVDTADVQTSAQSAKPSSEVRNPYDSDSYQFFSQLSQEERKEHMVNLYAMRRGALPCIDDPAFYNEKALLRKLYDPDFEKKALLSDKFHVKEWAALLIGDERVVPTYGVWDSPDEIDFEALPCSFTLKCSHGDGLQIDVPDKKELDRDFVAQQLNVWLSGCPAYLGDHIPYYQTVKPQVIAESLHHDEDPAMGLWVWCFDGSPVYVQVNSREDGLRCSSFFDCDWNVQPFSTPFNNHAEAIEKPSDLTDLVDAARTLSAGFDHVVVHFVPWPEGEHRFIDVSFMMGGGFANWKPARAGFLMGKLWNLNSTPKASGAAGD